MKTSVILSVFTLMLPFQNCAKARFTPAASPDSSIAAGALGAASGLIADPPPAAITICSLGSENGCDLGHAFVGQLYIEPRSQLVDSGTTYSNGPTQGDTNVNDYVVNQSWLATRQVNGQQQPLIVALSSLDSLNNQFASGFSTQDGQLVQVPDANGKFGSVPNYFALDLKANFHLGPNDAPGLYQMAIVADDGAQMYVTNAQGANPRLLVDDQIPASSTNPAFIPGSQFTRMGCSTVIGDTNQIQTIDMQADTVLPIEIRYVNGPAGLSLRVMYRAVPTGGPVDCYCETDVNSDPATKPRMDLPLVLDTTQLGSWKTISAANL